MKSVQSMMLHGLYLRVAVFSKFFLSTMQNRMSVAAAFALAAIFIGIVATPTHAVPVVIYDLQSDFSLTENSDTSTWSYRYKNGLDRDGNYELLTFSGTDLFNRVGLHGWTHMNRFSVPVVSQNQSNPPIDFTSGGILQQPGETMVHPGQNMLVVVSWLAPEDGTVDVSWKVTSQYTSGNESNGITWYVDHNITTLASGTHGHIGGSGQQFLSALNVAAGDRLNFILDPMGSHAADGNKVEATISFTAVPEPSLAAMLLLCSCLGGMSGIRRKRVRS